MLGTDKVVLGDPLTDTLAVGDPPQAAKRRAPQTTSETYLFMVQPAIIEKEIPSPEIIKSVLVRLILDLEFMLRLLSSFFLTN